MKPRENAVNTQPFAQADTVAPEVEVSAIVVQPEVPEEAEMEVILEESEGTPLGLSPGQNLESQPHEEVPQVENGPIVAQTPLLDSLAAMLRDSKGEPVEPISFDGLLTNDGAADAGKAIYEGVQRAERPTIAEIEDALGRQGSEGVELKPNGEVVIRPSLGEQDNGEYNLVVSIREGYIEGIKQQAESDNQTPEEWVSVKLAEYLEQWWFANGQR